MVYKGNIPQPADKLSVSQGDILEDFSQVGTIFDVDHVALDNATVASRGKHEQATLIHKAADPSTLAGEGKVYTVKDGSSQYLRYREESDGTVHDLVGSSSGRIFAAVTFVDQNVPTIAKAYNVSSITRSGSDYKVTFTTACSTADYAMTGTYKSNIISTRGGVVTVKDAYTTLTTECVVKGAAYSNGHITFMILFYGY